MDHVKSHVAGPHHAHDGVEIGPVVVALAAGLMDDAGDLQNVAVKDADGVGIGQHQAGCIRANGGLEGLHVDTAVRPGRDIDHREARHNRRGGIGAMGGVGDDNLGAAQISAACMVGLNQQQARELAVGACCRLEGHMVHAGDFAEGGFRFPEHLQATLDRMCRL